MKKVYYPLIAVSMTIISIFLVPIKSYAAGSYVSSSVDVNSNFRGVASCNSYMQPVTPEGEDEELDIAMFDCSVAIRNQRIANPNGYVCSYCSGYILWSCTVAFSMNSALGTSWRFSYDVEYGDSPVGVYCTVPVVNSGQNQLIIYFYTYMDNAAFYRESSIVSSVTVNLHITATQVVGGTGTPGITVNSVSLVSQGASAVLTQDPTWAQGREFVDFYTMYNAITTAVGNDMTAIVAYLASINTLFPQYMTNILNQLGTLDIDLVGILYQLQSNYNQDYSFYAYVINYLDNVNKQEASEAASEATNVEQEMSEVAESLEIQEPSIDGVFDDLDNMTDQASQHQLFFWLQGNSNILVSILIFTFAIALAGYVLYGRM